jgi:MFS family permease
MAQSRSERTRFAPNERNVLLLTGITHAATHYAELMYPTLAVALARETGIGLDHVLRWSFAGYLLFGVGSFPAGYLADRFGARRLLIASLVAMGLASVAAASSSPGFGLAACLTVLGGAGSIYHPAGMGLISHTVAARGRALGINGIFGSAGIALTPVLTAALTSHFGWRGALRISGAALLAAAGALLRFPIREPHREAEPGAAAAAAAGPVVRSCAGFALLCTCAMLAGISYRGNTLAQPPYFAERVSAMGYGAATSLAFLLGVAGQYVGGIVADRYELRRAYFLFHLASLPALLAMTALTELPLIGAAGLFTFFSLGMQPIENSLFAALTPARWRSTGYGVKFVLTFGVGSAAVWLVTAIQGAFGLRAAFFALAGVVGLLLTAIAAFATTPGLRAGVRHLPPAAGPCV